MLKHRSNTRVLKSEKDHSSHEWFKQVYEENFDKLYTYVISIVKDSQIAEDVVSEVFMNLWNMRSQTEGILKIQSYLFISVKNLAIRAVTKNIQQLAGQDLNSINQMEKSDPEEIYIGKELQSILFKAVEDLPDQCKLVYSMIKEEGKRNSEVATELGISEGTVKNHLLKAVYVIREKVTTYLEIQNYTSNNYTNLGSFIIMFWIAILSELL